MSSREELRAAVKAGDFEAVERLLAENRALLRHLNGLSYHQNSELRRAAARAVALAARHHPKQVGEVVKRLVWAMNDEAGTNAAHAPETLSVIAAQSPELLLPQVPDLLRIAHDNASLRPGISETLRIVARGCSGEVSKMIAAGINQTGSPIHGGHRGD